MVGIENSITRLGTEVTRRFCYVDVTRYPRTELPPNLIIYVPPSFQFLQGPRICAIHGTTKAGLTT
jgi:hypothetical protein